MTRSWRDSVLVRVGGAALSWFMFSLNFTLLYLVTFVVMALGGSCASGGPYEIAVQCPDNVAIFAPLSIFGGLAAVGVSLLLAQGFGTPLTTWAWPVLFIGLGTAFLLAFILGQDFVGLVLGAMFVIMGLVPLVLELRGSPQRVFLGQYTASGVQFFEGDRARRSLLSPAVVNPETAVRPTAAHWLLSLSITVVSVAAGYLTAMAWFPPTPR